MENDPVDKDFDNMAECQEHEVMCTFILNKNCKELLLTIYNHLGNKKKTALLKIIPISDDFNAFEINDNQLSLLKYFLECDDLDRNAYLVTKD